MGEGCARAHACASLAADPILKLRLLKIEIKDRAHKRGFE